MSVKKLFLLFFLWMSYCIVNGQNFDRKIDGQISSAKGDVAAIHISNISTNRGTITDIDGFFTISVRLNDTLVFSAVQFKRKEMVVTAEVLKSKLVRVFLEESLTTLDEVVVMPYNLSGKLDQDARSLKIGPVKTASTESLPNAYVRPLSQSERQLYTARTWDAKFYGLAFTAKLDPLFNYFSGRTKKLNKQVRRDSKTDLIKKIRTFYDDSLYITDLKIPKTEIDNFIFYCEADTSLMTVISKRDRLKLWDFLKTKSNVYRKNNDLD